MGDVVKLDCVTKLPIDPDDVLDGAKGRLDYVLLLGWDKDGRMYTASSEGQMERAVYIATKFVHRQHHGDYE